ncbi:hypothetical protein M5K25_014026 [Dendrobium thyrsiflorum]|uniref:Uncharacterized protein n=1 Tax=Dendrobium thyrsiflorum TaxID=117978 RepID=A0ABD0V1Q7_DENTH
MGPNQRPKAHLEGSNHNLDYQTISEHDILIPPADAGTQPDHHLRPEFLPDHHLRPDALTDYHLRPDVLSDHHLDAGLSLGQRLWSFRPPSPTMVLPTSVAKSWSLRPPLPVDNGLSDLRRPLTMVLSTSFADYGPFDLYR